MTARFNFLSFFAFAFCVYFCSVFFFFFLLFLATIWLAIVAKRAPGEATTGLRGLEAAN